MKQQQALVLTDQLISLVSDNSEKQKLLLSLKSIKEILEKQLASSQGVRPVSYTHLTLPTKA